MTDFSTRKHRSESTARGAGPKAWASFVTGIHAGRIAAALAVLLLCAAGPALARDKRIVDGNDAVRGDFPWMAALVQAGKNAYEGQVCGGSLIHANWVLTAAHCVTDDKGAPKAPADLKIALGVTDLVEDTPDWRAIKRIVVHPDYDAERIDADMALIELEKAATQPVVSLWSKDVELVGKSGLVVGWGNLSSEYWDYPQWLQQVHLPVVSNEVCNAAFNASEEWDGGDNPITANMICAGYYEGGASACYGDSGGPLLIDENGEWRQAGVVSWGIGCSRPGYYNAFVRVGHFMDFIRQYIPLAVEDTTLWFPHIDARDDWETDIALINGGASAVSAVARFRDESGVTRHETTVSLPAHGRQSWRVGRDIPDADAIRYLTVTGPSEALSGYTRFFQDGHYRVSVPATAGPCGSGTLILPHIDVTNGWWTGVSLLNTATSSRSPVVVFNTGHVKILTLPAGGHTAFTVAGLFGGAPPSGITSGTISGCLDLTGILLFGSDGERNVMDGVLVGESTETELIFPHVAATDGWWTGLVIFNSSASACSLTLTPYTDNGVALAPVDRALERGGRLVDTSTGIGLPAETAWVRVTSTMAVTGFELFGTLNGQGLAGYTVTGIRRSAGVFPRLDASGWTGLALVNTGTVTSDVTLTAYRDDGSGVSTKRWSLGPNEKKAGLAATFFDGPIDGATWIRFDADQSVAGFQLNGSDDGIQLDALPALSVR